ncbi:hypothetical protein CS0771_65470 [Catellatospora sp. IY07-71]|uniref:hypothetical protein n=1 Tax=Catellatospora sp. IY07-71 TaxID=2728827 RepID=UPI001BB3E949|nr:hypothetical protein [Catellatospora sp. IY07-71]BCJ77003.1 hypothetical protein CS0771_65470 [Catellatospora sp. IY07-71]
MVPTSNRQRILDALHQGARPLDDDQLSDATQIFPRQQVNQICRALEREGVIRRHPGPHQKLVNVLIQPAAVKVSARVLQPPTSVSDSKGQSTGATADPTAFPPGHSQEQRDAEQVMLELLGQQLGVALAPTRIIVAAGTRVEVDGADADRRVLVECWAHQGPPKVAQRHKVLADTLKLTWIATKIQPRPQLYLCLSDPLAAKPFLPTSKSWAAQALLDLGVTIAVVDLPADTRDKVRAAQQRQYR